jgi:triosephosphate isomerase (TIM)
MSRRPLFAGNWKMYKTPNDAREYARDFVPGAGAFAAAADIALCAPFIDLDALGALLEGSAVALGAQDCYWEPEGAFTGEVSAAMLASMGVQWCIVGHSERRRLFGETDDTVARKVASLLAEGVRPIVCVGETLEENKTGKTRERVTAQVHAALHRLTEDERASLVIAYEPIWAIGTGLADDPASANKTIGFIREAAGGLDRAVVLYGGSMKADNAEAFCAQPNIDGGLIGSASLDPTTFRALVTNGLRGIDAGNR